MPGSTLQFLGASGTVTGSRYLVSRGRRKFLLDCGMFQGLKELRQRNWDDPPFRASDIDAVVLSHAHIDHTGMLPRLVRKGYKGKIFCTPATADLLGVLLPDTAKLQEEDAEAANRHKYTKHEKALPLFEMADARNALKLLKRNPYNHEFRVVDGVTARYRRAGHILGSASVDLLLEGEKPTRLVFSGDIGRWNKPILKDPEFVPEADVLLVESTYGDRVHPPNPEERLSQVVRETVERGGTLVVPAFAVDRTQELIWMLRKLEDEKRIPVVPVYIDSPMAVSVNEMYCEHTDDHDIEMRLLTDTEGCPLTSRRLKLVRSTDESIALNNRQGPMIIISASGMATGGRVLHHLRHRLPDPRNTVLIVGFQAAGTRGRYLVEGSKELRIHGFSVPVNAKVEVINGLSGHADRDEIMKWLGGFTRPPRVTYLVHGEPAASEALQKTIQEKLGWDVRVAKDGETMPLGEAALRD